MTRFEGILMPAPTPFKDDGGLDESGLEALMDFYVAAGVQGYFLLGTHGQGMVMELDERKRAAELCVRRIDGRGTTVVHVGTADTGTTVDLARHAASLGVDAVGLVPPYYYPHNDYEVFAHYRAVAEAVPDTPIFIYDNTLTTRVHFTPAKVLKLLETVPNICGIKASYSSLAEVINYVKTLPDQVGVFPGSILFLLPGYSLGVRGAIHPPTSPFPEICVQLYRAFAAGDLTAAQVLHDKIAELNLFMEGYSGEHGRAVMFEAMKLRGLPIKKFPRWECKPFSDREKDTFREGIERIGIELAK